MSTANPAGTYPASAYPPGTPVAPAGLSSASVPHAAERETEIRVFGHSNLFYWWPVWLVGFIMAALTYADGHMMAVVPEGTVVETNALVDGQGGPRDVLVAPEKQPIPRPPGNQIEGQPPQPRIRVAASNNLGVIFVGTVLLVVLVTNITVRGLSSVIVIALIVIVSLLLAQFHLWDEIFRRLGELDVRMNAGGYLAFALPIFLLWLFSVFIYDHYTYLIVTRGQVRIRQAIGDGELAVDSGSVMLDKKRNDIFRHWLLGMGSGDLHVKTGGVSNLDFELPNVLFVGTKIERIQNLLREKEVSEQPAGR